MNNGVMEIKHDVKVNVREKDYRSTLLKVIDVDAIYAVTAGYSEIATIARQSRELGFEGPIYTFSGIDNNAEFIGLCPDGCGEIYIGVSATSEKMKEFNDRFKAKYGEEPSTPAAATSYDGTRMLLIALQNGEDSDSVREGLHAIRDFNGVSGIKQFEADKGWPIVERENILRTVKNGSYLGVTS